jgi:DNA-directed RNA polymerase specialized sigma24 family protein
MLDTGLRFDSDASAVVLERAQQHRSTFDDRFSRSRGLLYFLASRVLHGFDQADEAVQNCYLAASRQPQNFEYEGAFRSWLARILIDEALVILRQRRRPNHTVRSEEYSAEECVFTNSAAESSTEREY